MSSGREVRSRGSTVAIAFALALALALLVCAPARAATAIFQGGCPPYGDEHICSGEVPSYDGTLLDVDLTEPAQNTGSTHPLIVMLHGFGNNKHEWESLTDEGDGGDKYDWNSHWFSKHGYYVLTYTARGFKDPGPDRKDEPMTPGGSSADPDSGDATIHLKSRATEIKDTQWLAALVAYSFPDIDPSRVAVSGGSYGGGESWLQATQPEWTFPNQKDPSLPVLQLQVAVPKYGWTDLAYSLAPNGHPGPWPLESASQAEAVPPTIPQPPAGYCDVDQSLQNDPCYTSSMGHPESESGSGNPFGVDKLSYTQLFFTYGIDPSMSGGFQTQDRCDNPFAPVPLPDGAAGPAPVAAWYEQAVVAPGEPYSTAPGVDTPPWGAEIRHGLTECRGSYYQEGAWQAQAQGPRKVAIFSIQGWTDDLFTPVEAFRQFEYLKSLDPNWPVEVALADVGHPRAQNNPDTWHQLNKQAWQWLQSNINGSHDQQTTVSSYLTVCNGGSTPSTNQPSDVLTATTPEGLSNGKLSITYGHGGTTTSVDKDLNGAADDPIINYAVGQIAPHPVNCPASDGPAPYTGVSQPLPRDVTYVGLGSVTVPYTLAATPPADTAQLDVRVWDVPPGPVANQAGSDDCQKEPVPQGCPLLITRGTYRLDVQGGYDSQTGQIRIPLFGNEYKFQVGDQIRLDLTQDDSPYLRPSNAASSITFGDPTLTLPTRESGTTALTVP